MVLTTGWALAVIVAVFCVGRISGAHLNPAVTISMATIGAFPWAQVPGDVAAQIIGAFLGAVVVWIVYFPHWAETEDPDLKLAVFATSPAIRRPAANFISEVIGTALFLFGVLAIVPSSLEN